MQRTRSITASGIAGFITRGVKWRFLGKRRVSGPANMTKWYPALFSAILCAAAVASTLQVGEADRTVSAERSTPAEESRLDVKVFREALKARGLTELLELHLKDYPPPGIVAKRLMARDMKLAEYADLSRPLEERMAALAEANAILEELLEEAGDDLRRFEWRFTLAHSILYDQAEPMFTNILYRGGSKADHRELLELTSRAVNVLTRLTEELTAEYARVEGLSVAEFEKLERRKYIEGIDLLGPRANYLLAWARFYDTLPRDHADPTRASNLHRIMRYFAENKALLDTPHRFSRIQVQALVLAGMTKRRLNDHVAARSCFERAVRIADRITDPAQRSNVQWAVTLARIERVRNDRDDGRFDAACDGLADFRWAYVQEHGENLGLRVVAGLLERSVYRAWSDAAHKAGLVEEAERYREKSWKALARTAELEADDRDEVYATLYEAMGPDADPAELDPFEQCALIAGLLFEAGLVHDAQADDTSNRLLDRAVRIGEHFLASATDSEASLVPEVLYNVAVAEYRRGHIVDAVKRFLEVGRGHRDYENALSAATYAVQLAAELYGDPALRGRPEIQRLYLSALRVIVERYLGTESSRYWRFYYAHLLDEMEQYDRAAAEYALVPAGHDHYLESMFMRVRCLALGLHAQADQNPDDLLEIRRRADDLSAVQREFVSRASGELIQLQIGDSARLSMLRTWVARAKVMAAEILVLPQINRPERALEYLAEFETATSAADEAMLAARVWRVRLVAYERLGRLDDAAKAIPAFVAADPAGAGPTLQALFTTLAGRVESLRAAGDQRGARQKANVVLLLAEQIVAWVDRFGSDIAGPDRSTGTVQLAEANLYVGRCQRARELFEPLADQAADAGLLDEPLGRRVLVGYAESLYQLGEWASALPMFNKLATRLQPADPIRWRSLLRDLQCRTALDHQPEDILRVIRQQRFLYPDLGGSVLAGEFEKLERENQRRADTG